MKLAVSVIAAFVCATSFAEAPTAPCDASQKTKQAMTRIDGLLSASKAFFLATVDGDQPKLRPLGAHHVVDGKPAKHPMIESGEPFPIFPVIALLGHNIKEFTNLADKLPQIYNEFIGEFTK